jgi:glycerol-3-phosphate dehydrogenase
VVADPDIMTAVEGATLLIFVTPHQFLKFEQLREARAPLLFGSRFSLSSCKGVLTFNPLVPPVFSMP